MRRIVGIVLCGFLVSTALSGQQASAPKKNASSVPGADKKGDRSASAEDCPP